MTTHRSRNIQHLSRDLGELLRRQTKREKRGFCRTWLGPGRGNGLLGLLGWLVRRRFAHGGTGHQPTSITPIGFTFYLLLAMATLSLVFWAQPAFAHNPPVIAPTRLEFDAPRAPKNCNDVTSFTSILSTLTPREVLRNDADRRLVVHIHWSSTGSKRADVSLIDAQGVTVAERHTPYAAKTECYKVLWEIAHDAAEILGAFEPPPQKEPASCPACPPSAPCPPVSPCPAYPPLQLAALKIALPPMLHSFVGLGVFVGSGIFSKLGAGPYFLLGMVPSPRLSQLNVEFEGAWTSQTSESLRMHSVPLVGSLCWVRGIVRFCGGFATTISFSNQSPPNDPLQLMFGGNFRVGTELFNHGPLSIRADVFGRFAFAERRFGAATVTLEQPTPFAAGLAVMGAWSFD